MSGPLTGVRVLDLAGDVAGGYATKLLAGFDATVLLGEPPGGDPCRHTGPFPDDSADTERSGMFLHLGAGKHSTVIDLTTEADRALVLRLLPETDILVTALLPEQLAAAGLDPAKLGSRYPRLVHISITHLGLSGPYRDRQATELTDYAMGGYLGFGGEPERGPLMIPGDQAQHHGGMQAAIAALVALAERDRSGHGQFVECSTVEAMLSAHSWLTTSWSHSGQIMSRTPTDLIPCADGWVFFMMTNLEGLAVLIEQPDLLDDPRFATPLMRLANRDALQEIVGGWCKTHTMEEIYTLGQELRVAVTPVRTVAGLADAEQLAVRGWFREVQHPQAGALRLPGPPYHLTATPVAISAPAPLLDQHGGAVRSAGWAALAPVKAGQKTAETTPAQQQRTALSPVTAAYQPAYWRPAPPSLPLTGLRVLELTANWAGPLAGRHLADLGAEVIKIEAPARPATRGLHSVGNDSTHPRHYNRSGYFNKLNRNKLGLVLDLAKPKGRDLFLDLVRRADVVIENNSARVMGNLGIDYPRLKEVKPDIILCSMSGFGGSGPERDYVAYGSNIETVCGLAALMNYPGDPTPHRTGSYYADPVAGGHGAIAILAALRHRDRTGEGQWIDLSLLESAAALFGGPLMEWQINQRLPAARGNRHPSFAPQGCYPCAGRDAWLAISIRDDDDWRRLCAATGRGDLLEREAWRSAAGRQAAHDAIDEEISAWTRTLDHYRAAQLLQEAGVAAAPVLMNFELLSDPHLADRGFYQQVWHSECGVLPFPGLPWRFGRTPGLIRWGAPCFGEHNRAIFSDVLGQSQEQIAALYAEGITADEPQVLLLR